MTRRDRLGGEERWSTHQWVRDEINYGRTVDKRAIAIVEGGVDNTGMYEDNERIDFDAADPLPAFVRLSRQLASWKQQHGRTVRAFVLPDDVRRRADSCRYRLWTDDARGEWTEAALIPAVGGTQVLIRGVPDDDALIELEVDGGGEVSWRSRATPQSLMIEVLPPDGLNGAQP